MRVQKRWLAVHACHFWGGRGNLVIVCILAFCASFSPLAVAGLLTPGVGTGGALQGFAAPRAANPHAPAPKGPQPDKMQRHPRFHDGSAPIIESGKIFRRRK
jgi:hypothetical protein